MLDVDVDHYAERFNFVDNTIASKVSGHTWSLADLDVVGKNGETDLA
jgi:hypothetical protein